jgi:hypothetical protein
LGQRQQRSYDAVIETEKEVSDEPTDDGAPEAEAAPVEVPEGIDPETGELLAEVDAPHGELDEAGDEERRRELAAERQQAEQEEAAAQADAEKLMKQLNRSAENYAKRVIDLLGGDLTGWQACPLCAEGLPGFRVPRMPDPEYLAQVKVAIGEDPDPDLPNDGYSRRCESCDGWGKVQTGSRVTTQKAAQCHDCAGRGWIAVGTERAGGNITSGNGTTEHAPIVLQDNVNNDPPEVEKLRQLGYVVVPGIVPLEAPGV